MSRLRALLFLVLALLTALPAAALSSSADAPHLRVELVVPASALAPGQTALAGLYFKLEPGWHVYWKNAGDAGEPPHAQWTLPAGVTAGPLQFPAPQRLPLGPLMDYGYENEVLFPLDLKIAPTAALGPATLHVKVDWLVCNTSCLPGKAELELARVIAPTSGKAPDDSLIRKWKARLPKPAPAALKASFKASGSHLLLIVETGKPEKQGIFFPADESILDNPAPQPLQSTKTGLQLLLKKSEDAPPAIARLNGLLELSGGRAYELSVAPSPGTIIPIPNLPIEQGGFAVGGSGPSEQPPEGHSSVSGGIYRIVPGPPPAPQQNTLLKSIALAFLGGLLLNLMPCVFPVLFIKGLALVRSGNEERRELRIHGLVYTAGILVSFWLLVAALLGLRAAGATLGWGFQFQSPIFLALMAGLLFFLGLSLAGQFEIGLSMTGMGGSLAQKQGYTGSFFTGVLAVIVATPCTAPMMGAAVGYALAQSALTAFAVFTSLALGLAAPYVALTLRPGWTRWLPKPGPWMELLRQAVAVPIFSTVIWLSWVLARAYGAELLAALLAEFLLLAIAGAFLGRWPARRWATVTALVVLLAAVALAVAAPALLPSDSATPAASATSTADWQPWSAEAVAQARAQGHPVFVDFTASWCLSCQVNEKTALNRAEVVQAFAATGVVRMRADWTRHDEAITRELTRLGRSGVPTYVLFAPNGQTSPRLLPEVLTPSIVLEALKSLPAASARLGQ